MSEKPYHHGDLRNALIEAGIELINDKGISQFSLRKVAGICGVTHAAPYAHFKDMGALITAMSEHVTEQFMDRLRSDAKGQEAGTDLIRLLGRTYITFFSEHPNYFQFLFYNSDVIIDLDGESADGYPPFTLFRDTVYAVLDGSVMPHSAKKQILVALLAQVHGVTALLTNPRIKYSGDWLDIIGAMKGTLL